jgi:hypothetical protein
LHRLGFRDNVGTTKCVRLDNTPCNGLQCYVPGESMVFGKLCNLVQLAETPYKRKPVDS